MVRANTKIGDIFSVNLNAESKKYLQYIISDLTQLNSDVIRVFKKKYPIDANIDLQDIVNGEVDFFAHCVTKWGLKLGYWEKVGNLPYTGKIEVIFRSSGDNPQIGVSNNWWTWKVNQQQEFVGKLDGINRNSEVGSVIPPDSIVHRMKTGNYDFVYPEYL